MHADSLGIVAVSLVPLLSTLLLVPGELALANLIAAVPGRLAAHSQLGTVLRSE